MPSLYATVVDSVLPATPQNGVLLSQYRPAPYLLINTPPPPLSACTTEYIRYLVDRVTGLKVILLDAETVGIISLLYSQSKILEKEIFLVERIDSAQREPVKHLKAICFLRPTADNFLRLLNDLKSPLYSEYHLFFTNIVPPAQLERLARGDELEVVRQVRELFADVFVFDNNLFSLNMPSVSRLFRPASVWDAYEESLSQRIIDGLFSVCCSLNTRPLIRYQKSSDICSFIGRRLCLMLEEQSDLFKRHGNLMNNGWRSCTFLLLDRREDPVTPLLNKWTYRSMLHELIGIENNRVSLKKVPGIKKELEEIVMSPVNDKFYGETYLSNFGQLGFAVKKYLESYQEQTQNTAKIDSLEDMQRFVEVYPEFQKLSGNVAKHVALIHELSRLVEVNGLLDVSLLEQDLACHENMVEQHKSLLERMKSELTQPIELLRLVMLYALRYEGHHSVSSLKAKLPQLGIANEQVELVDAILNYGGSNVRSGDLFQNKNLLAIAKSTIQRGFKGTPNVYTQHRPQLAGILEQLVKGKLKESNFPYASAHISGSGPASINAKDRYKIPANIVVFIVGGATYDEAEEIERCSVQAGCNIIFGGSTILNTKMFLADVSQLTKGGKKTADLPWVHNLLE